MNYKVSRNNQEYGPYTLEELQQYIAEGTILPDDYTYDGTSGLQSASYLQVQTNLQPGPFIFRAQVIQLHKQSILNLAKYPKTEIL